MVGPGLPCVEDGIPVDAMCRNGHKTYTNLTQPSFSRQLKNKNKIFHNTFGVEKKVRVEKIFL